MTAHNPAANAPLTAQQKAAGNGASLVAVVRVATDSLRKAFSALASPIFQDTN